MKISIRRALSFVPFVVVSALAGCASSDGAETGDDANVTLAADGVPTITADGAPTIEDWQFHPKIKAIKAEVVGLDKLEEVANPACGDASMSKHEIGGKVRTVMVHRLAGNGETRLTAAYDAGGALRYVQLVRINEKLEGTSLDVFLEPDGAVLFQVIQNIDGYWREPARAELYRPNALYRDPAKWLTSACGI